MVITHFYIFQHGNSIVCQRSQRKVFRKQVWGNTKFIKSHQSSTQRGSYLARNATLMKTNDTLILLTHAYKNDFRGSYTASCQREWWAHRATRWLSYRTSLLLLEVLHAKYTHVQRLLWLVDGQWRKLVLSIPMIIVRPNHLVLVNRNVSWCGKQD